MEAIRSIPTTVWTCLSVRCQPSGFRFRRNSMEVSQIADDFIRTTSMNTSSGENSAVHTPLSPAEVQEAIRRRAEEIYVWSGKVSGHDLENWALAEEQIKSEIAARQLPARSAVV